MSIFLGECMAVGCDGMLGSTAQECIRICSEKSDFDTNDWRQSPLQ